jgi:hypothetical protein
MQAAAPSPFLSPQYQEHESDMSMSVYLYRYACARWWGTARDVRYLHVDRGADLVGEVLRDAQHASGSRTCDVALLQQFRVCFTPEKTFPPHALFPVPPSIPDDTAQVRDAE